MYSATFIRHSFAPNLEWLRAHGAYSWRALTIRRSYTLPSHASMLSGVDAEDHHLIWNRWWPEKGFIRVPTIFSIARSAGIPTAMFVGKPKFRHIAARVAARRRRGEPAISVDTKKKEVLGNLKNPGRAYHPRGRPPEVKTHDFPDPKLGKAVPYGVYDIHRNEAGVSVGISHDTAEFAVGAIRRWWAELGHDKRQLGPT